MITIGTDILSRTVSELSQLLLFKFGQFTFFDPAFFSVGGGLGTKYGVFILDSLESA